MGLSITLGEAKTVGELRALLAEYPDAHPLAHEYDSRISGADLSMRYLFWWKPVTEKDKEFCRHPEWRDAEYYEDKISPKDVVQVIVIS